MNKKQEQLGINPSTASHRLTKDILFSLVVETGKDICFQCGGKLSRENFSIEHKVPWLNSENPYGLYFNLGNIAYSHLSCNISAKRDFRGKPVCGSISKYTSGCKCEACTLAWNRYKRERYSPSERRDKYLATGN